jgi:hypothetical protein
VVEDVLGFSALTPTSPRMRKALMHQDNDPSRQHVHTGDDDDAPTRQHSIETELHPYDDDDVATQPWPPAS